MLPSSLRYIFFGWMKSYYFRSVARIEFGKKTKCLFTRALITENKVWCTVEMSLQMNTIQGEEVGMIISVLVGEKVGLGHWCDLPSSSWQGKTGNYSLPLLFMSSARMQTVCVCVSRPALCTVLPVPLRADPTKAENNQPLVSPLGLSTVAACIMTAALLHLEAMCFI